MDFPDLNHLLQLQKYLWQWPSSRASVMVGAGLSLNSRPSPGVSTCFLTWSELAQAMFDEIYPPQPDETTERKTQREKQFNPSSALRLASEYEVAFSRRKLESFLLEKIPDSGHQPGNIHSLLLQLPWKDVYTTNYDTLLERTEVPGRAYQPVNTAHDLTNAFSPRIIKLHGSFPSQTPFIITEEDYRTYPKWFAPFVNTVRQSLIENAFVLIGFSGDDPNFLEWTGWIRDELGGHHAPFYLVGPLTLDNVQRSLLTQRGVTPIDLTPVFSGKNPPDGIHASAIEWFLRSLLAAKPQRPEKWPEFYTTPQTTTDFEPPILTNGLVKPEKVLFSGPQGTLDEATVMKVIERWRFERNQYPGWLVPTNEIRSSLWTRTKNWITPLITFAENWSPVDRILLFREINWRIDKSMLPLFSELMAPFESTVDDLLPCLKDNVPTKLSIEAMRSINVSDTEVAEAWLEIAFGLLRDAREAYDSERWNTFKEKIDQVVGRYPQSINRHHYEQALWMMWNIERSQAKDVLAKWSPSPHSPLAVMWKAGLLAELDELIEARSLLRTALREIRRSLYNTHGRKIDLLSLEGWCTHLLFSVEIATDATRWAEIHDEFSERWQELKAWDCDPLSLIEYFDEVLSETPPVPKKGKQIVRGFDPGRISVRHHFGGGRIERWLPAFACIRLYEQAGIPIRLFSRDALKNVCKWIAPFTEFWSPAILIRAGKVDALTKHGFMDRTQVATMEPALAKSLNKWATGALKRELSSLSGKITMGSAQESLLEVLTEVLSRLAFKLESADLQEAFSLALELHGQPGISSHIRLHESCEPWFRRLFEAADGQQLLVWLPELLKFPLYDESDRSSNPLPNPWPDPMTCLPIARTRAANEAHPGLFTRINEATKWLLERAKSESGEGRRRAIIRLINVFYMGLMAEEEQKSLGAVLWEKSSENGLPDLPDLLCFSYLLLPKPVEVDVVSKVKEYLLTFTPIKPVSNDATARVTRQETERRMIQELALVSKPIVQLPRESKGIIEWNLDETKELREKTIEWWENDRVVLALEKYAPFPGGTVRISSNLENIGIFLARAVLPKMDSVSEDEWDKLIAFLFEVREHEVYLTTALLYVLLHRSSEGEKVIQTIFDDLSSGDEKAVRASAKAVRHWVYLADEGLLDNPPTAAVDELIRRVVFRRFEGIRTCLVQLALLLIEKPDSFNSDQVNLVVASLTPWRHATCLPLSEDRDGDFPEEERPSLRVLLGSLASALSVWLREKSPDQPEPSEISLLRECCKADSLPEIRRAFDTWKLLETN